MCQAWLTQWLKVEPQRKDPLSYKTNMASNDKLAGTVVNTAHIPIGIWGAQFISFDHLHKYCICSNYNFEELVLNIFIFCKVDKHIHTTSWSN